MESTTSISALTIAGFDPSAGAGILADLKTFAAHGIFAQACITGLTVQSTVGIKGLAPLDPQWVMQTLNELASDSAFSIIKLGALVSSEICTVVADFLRANARIPVVCDPVLRSTSGFPLLDAPGIQRLITEILPKCSWLTPNWEELAVLTNTAVSVRNDVEQSAQRIQASFPQLTVLVTGGGRLSPDDCLLSPGQAPQWVPGKKVETRATHGTGCTMSSALAARLALFPGEPPFDRVSAAKRYVEGAMRHAPGLGRGSGPLNHFWKYESVDTRA